MARTEVAQSRRATGSRTGFRGLACSRSLGQEGQSALEFLLMLPLLVGLTMVMIRVNSAIQASIVNQKYARSFIHFFAFNSPTYPISNAREAYRDNMAASKSNQFVVGIGEDPLPGDQFVSPAAPQIKIAKNRGSRDPQSFPEQTGTVLVRNTVSLCTQPIVVRGPNGLVPVEGGKSGLAESSRFAFCKGVFE